MGNMDQDYIELCLNGRPDEFRNLILRYQSALLAYLTGKFGNSTQAEEAAQETLVRAFFSLNKLEKSQSFYPWLLGIANHVVQAQIYAEQRQRRAKQISAQRVEPGEFDTDFDLEKAVARLPDQYRQVVLLRYYGDCSCKEVAQKLQMPLGTVTKTLSRAHAMMREYLTLDQAKESSE